MDVHAITSCLEQAAEANRVPFHPFVTRGFKVPGRRGCAFKFPGVRGASKGWKTDQGPH